jgi:hypothetical protein
MKKAATTSLPFGRLTAAFELAASLFFIAMAQVPPQSERMSDTGGFRTAYCRATHVLTRDRKSSSRSSQTPALEKNDDESVDVYFGTKAPAT